jgi:hypothetical protein
MNLTERYKRFFHIYMDGEHEVAIEMMKRKVPPEDWVEWLIQIKSIFDIIKDNEWALYCIGNHCNERDFAGNVWQWLTKVKIKEIEEVYNYYIREDMLLYKKVNNTLFPKDFHFDLNIDNVSMHPISNSSSSLPF